MSGITEVFAVIAALLHVATIGWGVLYNETDGQYAGAAREMLEACRKPRGEAEGNL